jgi:hypothetical protein
VRNALVPRFRVKTDGSSDLNDATLTAASELMLAQAAECFFQKAECGTVSTFNNDEFITADNTSSPVTSQIAVHASDYYDIAYKSTKQGNSFGRYRFPKVPLACIAFLIIVDLVVPYAYKAADLRGLVASTFSKLLGY